MVKLLHSHNNNIAATLTRAIAYGFSIALMVTAGDRAGAQQYDASGRDVTGTLGGLGQQQTQGQQYQTQPQPSQNSAYPLPTERSGPVEIQNTTATSSGALTHDSPLVTDTGVSDVGVATLGASAAGRQRQAQTAVAPPPPNEFEHFVEQRLGHRLPRFGANLIVPATRNYSVPASTTVPPAYVLGPGDEIFIGLAGSIEGSVSVQIDSNGSIFLPRVGQINLTGVTYASLKAAIDRAVGQRYRGFTISAAVTRLRGIRVFVTGFANNPGSYTVDGLSTLVNAVFAAGGPSAGGSFRTVHLIRNGEVVSDFDLYAFLRDGDRTRDAVLQNGDVLSIAPLGDQVALTGSVNQEAVYEVKPGESLNDLLRYAGGGTVVADHDRVILYTLANASTIGGVEVARTSFAAQTVAGGDIVQVLSKGTLANPLERQTVVVRIEGEVSRPGNYVVPPGTTFDRVFELAGGTTPRAYLFGTAFQRVAVRTQQRASYDEALRQLETALAGAPLTTDSSLSAAQLEQQAAAGRALLDRLRQAEPDGRVVLPILPDGSGLPGALPLESNDVIIVPARPATVGVFGSVYRPASFLIDEGRPRRVRDYLLEAGGTLRLADKRDIFVVHVNGAVVSRRTGALSQPVLPGDIVFVPAKTQNGSFLARLAQLSSIVFNGAIGAAAVVSLSR